MADHIRQNNNFITPISGGAQVRSSVTTLESSNSQEMTRLNINHDVVDVNLTLNSSPDVLCQSPATQVQPVQLRFRQNGNDNFLNRSLSHPIIHNGINNDIIDVHNMSNSQPIQQPQNTVNINLIMGNNSSININLLNNNNNNNYNYNYSSQFLTNTSHNVSLPSLPSNNQININNNNLPLYHQETLRNLAINENPQFLTSHASYSSPMVSENQENLLPFPRQSTILRQAINYQNHLIRQSRSDLSFRRLSSRYSPYQTSDNYLNFTGSSSMSPTTEETFFDVAGNDDNNETNNNNEAVEPQVRVSQASEQPRQQRTTAGRTRNPANPKYGPYTCPKCENIFRDPHVYAAHIQQHYKDESPAERKKRRESKFKSKDLHISESSEGITVMPGAPPMEIGAVGSDAFRGSSSGVTIKQEIKSEPSD